MITWNVLCSRKRPQPLLIIDVAVPDRSSASGMAANCYLYLLRKGLN